MILYSYRTNSALLPDFSMEKNDLYADATVIFIFLLCAWSKVHIYILIS